MWQWLSTPPGSTSFPRASMSRARRERRADRGDPPAATPMSAWNVSAAVATVPLRMVRSNTFRRTIVGSRRRSSQGGENTAMHAAPPLHRADDGLVGPPLPVLLPPARAACGRLLRDDHHRRARPRRRAAPPGLRPRRASGRAAARRAASRPTSPHCARLGERWGYDEINLNCGCPSRARAARRVRRLPDGRAGARRRLPEGDAGCGVDPGDGQAPARHRSRARTTTSCAASSRRSARAGCRTFIVHARNAVLKGLSPKDNREVPPLRYAEVHRLKRGVSGARDRGERRRRDVAAGAKRAARARRRRDARPRRVPRPLRARRPRPPAVRRRRRRRRAPRSCERMHRYAVEQVARGTPLRAIARHMLGLYHGRPGGRRWRQLLSDATRLAANDPELLLDALAPTEARGLAVAA